MTTPEIIDFAAFAEVERLIVVAAHPDDLETICGGTVSRLVQAGVKVFSVNCTLGDLGTQDSTMTRAGLSRARAGETEAAAQLLGLTQTFNLGRRDGELVADLELRAQIARLYRLTQADTLFTFDPFWTGQVHPDHRAAGQAALDAYMPAKMPLYQPEQLAEAEVGLSCLKRIFYFSTDRNPEIYIDVSADYERKVAASLAHTSQFPADENLNWMRERDGARGEVIGAKYAEVFKRTRVW